MTNLSRKQESGIFREAEKYDMIDPGIAGIKEELKKAKDIISQYWIKYNEKDGYWYAKVPNPKRGGKKTAIKRRSKKAREEAILEAHYRRTGEAANVNAPSFSQLYPLWRAYKIRVKEHLESTAIRNDGCYKKYLKNADWVDRDISQIKPIEIRKWMKITAADRAPTKHDFTNLHGIINGVFQFALDEGYVEVPIAPFISGIGRNSRLFTPMKSQLPEYDATQVYTKEEAEIIYLPSGYSAHRKR